MYRPYEVCDKLAGQHINHGYVGNIKFNLSTYWVSDRPTYWSCLCREHFGPETFSSVQCHEQSNCLHLFVPVTVALTMAYLNQTK